MSNKNSLQWMVLACLAVLLGCGSESKKPSEPSDDSSVSRSVATGGEAVVGNSDGVTLSVFGGTVPTDPTGQPGQLVFSIEPSSIEATPPAGFTSLGGVWQMGPEGLTFGERCRLTMKVPDTSGGYVLGRLNTTTNRWEIVPAVLNSAGGDHVSADVKHLSIWSLFRPTTVTTNPRAYGALHMRNTDGTRLVSLCIRSYTLRYPDTDANFVASAAGCMLSEAGHNGGAFGLLDNANFVLPQGTYVFEATRSQPISGLTSTWADGWIEMDPVSIETPWVFGTAAPEITLHPSGWQNVTFSPLFGPCEGDPDYSFGTGPVQVTLSWDDPVDLDLHVLEPSGEEIYYAHAASATGGQLDRDRVCSSTSSRSPENVFWGTQTAAPRGTYTVKVALYSLCNLGSGAIPFRIRTVVDGVAKTYAGSAVEGETVTVTTFNR